MIDMGQPGGALEAQEGEAGNQIVIAFGPEGITVDGQPVQGINEALQMVLQLYQSATAGDAEGQVQAGYEGGANG